VPRVLSRSLGRSEAEARRTRGPRWRAQLPIAGRARARAQQNYEFVRLPRCFRNGQRNYPKANTRRTQRSTAYNIIKLVLKAKGTRSRHPPCLCAYQPGDPGAKNLYRRTSAEVGNIRKRTHVRELAALEHMHHSGDIFLSGTGRTGSRASRGISRSNLDRQGGHHHCPAS